MVTVKGKKIPVDYDDEIEREEEFDPDRMVSHFDTCPNAEDFRRH